MDNNPNLNLVGGANPDHTAKAAELANKAKMQSECVNDAGDILEPSARVKQINEANNAADKTMAEEDGTADSGSGKENDY